MGRCSHLLTDTVTVSASTGLTAAAEPSYGAQTTISARVEHGTGTLIEPDGNRLTFEHRIVSEVEILRTTKVWLPGDDTGADEGRRVLGVRKARFPGETETLFETLL